MKPPKSPARRTTGTLLETTTSSTTSNKTQAIKLSPSLVRLQRILVPVDFSEFTAAVVNYALPLARQFEGELILLHVFEPRSYSLDSIIVPREMEEANIELKQRAQKRLEELRAQVVSGGDLKARSVVRSGKPFHEICQTAEELGCDLIVIGTHGYTGLKHFYLGSTAERVVRHAPCPVLTVRNPKRKSQGKSPK